jgi:N-acyl-D-aspartate/D-glutamate deacylase
MVEWKVEIPGNTISREWYNYIWVEEVKLDKNKGLVGKTLKQIADANGKRIIDAFLDLVVEEKLETTFMQAENNIDIEAMKAILNYPNALIGLSDGGAHVQYHGGYGFSTRLLGEWVREKQIMSLENAVRRLTFDSASTFGLYDRGLLRPGMVADITVFDPETVKPLPEYVVHDFPAGGWRFKEPAAGIYATFVNGRMLMKEGRHTGDLPGHVLRNSRYQAAHR